MLLIHSCKLQGCDSSGFFLISGFFIFKISTTFFNFSPILSILRQFYAVFQDFLPNSGFFHKTQSHLWNCVTISTPFGLHVNSTRYFNQCKWSIWLHNIHNLSNWFRIIKCLLFPISSCRLARLTSKMMFPIGFMKIPHISMLHRQFEAALTVWPVLKLYLSTDSESLFQCSLCLRISFCGMGV